MKKELFQTGLTAIVTLIIFTPFYFPDSLCYKNGVRVEIEYTQIFNHIAYITVSLLILFALAGIYSLAGKLYDSIKED